MRLGDERLIQIMAGPRRAARCRDCRRPIEWAVLVPKGRNVPLDPNPLVLRYTKNEGGVRLLVIAASAMHFATCRSRMSRQDGAPVFTPSRGLR